jgi:hypothetical protein
MCFNVTPTVIPISQSCSSSWVSSVVYAEDEAGMFGMSSRTSGGKDLRGCGCAAPLRLVAAVATRGAAIDGLCPEPTTPRYSLPYAPTVPAVHLSAGASDEQASAAIVSLDTSDPCLPRTTEWHSIMMTLGRGGAKMQL